MSTQGHHLNNWVALEYLMQHTKFQGGRLFGSREVVNEEEALLAAGYIKVWRKGQTLGGDKGTKWQRGRSGSGYTGS